MATVQSNLKIFNIPGSIPYIGIKKLKAALPPYSLPPNRCACFLPYYLWWGAGATNYYSTVTDWSGCVLESECCSAGALPGFPRVHSEIPCYSQCPIIFENRYSAHRMKRAYFCGFSFGCILELQIKIPATYLADKAVQSNLN